MMRCVLILLSAVAVATAQNVPSNLTVEGVPAFSPELRKSAARYMEFRKAEFLGWHPTQRRMLISTRFGDTSQLHTLTGEGAARKQVTFAIEPTTRGSWQPKQGHCIVFSRDSGGGEFYQLYRLDNDGTETLLTDGKSRNTGAAWSHDGSRIAYTSTRRNGKDNDIFVQDPFVADSARMVLEVKGGGWEVLSWSHDMKRIALGEYISANESRVHLLDPATGKLTRISPEEGLVAWSGGQFSPDDKFLYCTTDLQSEFHRLARINNDTGEIEQLLLDEAKHDVEGFALSPDGQYIAYVLNADGSSQLRFLEVATKKFAGQVKLKFGDEVASGIISNVQWNTIGDELGFSLSAAGISSDAYSVKMDLVLREWTNSETGGLDMSTTLPAELVRIESFDGMKMSGFLYRPDPAKFPGKRPCVIQIHGGPEGQSRPDFLGKWNYLPRELGVAIFFPNVRGSEGYGKTFLAADNGFKREDSVKDIGAFIGALKADERIDGDRLAVMGGSYGGYMSLASLIHFGDHLRCGIDIVGISNFLTFLKNTQDYRRDLRRVEYGDERNEQMAAHLAKISPTTQAADIRDPLFIVQGKNDPRVPVTEAKQMAEAVRAAGGKVWYLEAADEGHGFQKKANADFLFLSVIEFLKAHLL
jgi:dipeptidyl aminopeptidase/acylaminoacyl peptidase